MRAPPYSSLLLLLLFVIFATSASAEGSFTNWPERYGGHDPAATLTGMEQGSMALLRELLAQRGVAPCLSSVKLTNAARAHARQLLVDRAAPGRADVALVRREVRRAGSYDPTVVPWAVSFSTDPDLEARLANFAQRLASRPPTHCGVGLASVEDRQVLVVVGVRRRVELETFPASVASGSAARLEGTLVTGYRAPTVLVTTPLGEVRERRVLRRSGRFGAWLRFPTPGRYTVEVMASGPQGPEIVALFPVFVDSEPWDEAGTSRVSPRFAEGRDMAEATLLQLVNLERQQRGMLPLAWDPQLQLLARQHSREMMSHGYFGHVSPESGDLTARLRDAAVFTRRAAENLVRSSSSSRAHARLMESPSHRANILDPNLTHLGIGIESRNGELVVTQIFVSW